ncbi:DUF222 domain-containing protein [Arthrobacter sp. MPF02]|uniref:HNH endonuclease signature motif containing protein n=1 Tax=Arthrobacter sp. MPF02 TaxID=3388492 RepID=UPI0039846D5C
MGNGVGAAAAMEAIYATVVALAALDAEDAALADAGSSGSAGNGVDVLRRAYEIRLERLALEKKLESQAAARKARSVVEAMDLQQAMTPPDAPLHDRTYTEISTVEEIAGILTISSGAASAFVAQSRQVCALPPVLDALSAGTLTWQQAKIFADETENLDHPSAAALVEHFLDPNAPNPARGCPAGQLVPARLRAKVRGWRERHHPDSIEKRHRKSAADRRVEYTPDRDGMAWISAYLPADTAQAIWNRTTAIARGLQGPDEHRTLPQRKADVLATQLLTHKTSTPEEDAGTETNTATAAAFTTEPGKVPTPRTEVLVTVPVFALLGLTDEPAFLDGYGPIPASMARKLLADGAESFHRVLINPRDGAPLEIGRTSYRLTKAMKKALQLRDGKCTFPGCNNNSLDNETDHLTAWQHGGTTGISNLAQLCPKHHRLKHNSSWEPTAATKDEPPGWTSPTGRHYQAEQTDREASQWPNQIGVEQRDSEGQHLEVGVWSMLPNAASSAYPAWLDTAPPHSEPPGDEPSGEYVVDSDDFAPEDPVWDAFYAKPFILPPDPQPDWELMLS